MRVSIVGGMVVCKIISHRDHPDNFAQIQLKMNNFTQCIAILIFLIIMLKISVCTKRNHTIYIITFPHNKKKQNTYYTSWADNPKRNLSSSQMQKMFCRGNGNENWKVWIVKFLFKECFDTKRVEPKRLCVYQWRKNIAKLCRSDVIFPAECNTNFPFFPPSH